MYFYKKKKQFRKPWFYLRGNGKQCKTRAKKWILKKYWKYENAETVRTAWQEAFHPL